MLLLVALFFLLYTLPSPTIPLASPPALASGVRVISPHKSVIKDGDGDGDGGEEDEGRCATPIPSFGKPHISDAPAESEIGDKKMKLKVFPSTNLK